MHDQLDIPSRPSYRVARPEGMDPNTKRLALIAGGIGGVLLLLVGAYSVVGHRPHGIPVIEADSRPVRVKPANPGGLEVTGGDDAILSGIDDDKEGTAPPPEAPAPQALQAAEAKAKAQAEAARLAAAAPTPVPSAATPAVERGLAAQPAQPVSLSNSLPAASPPALTAMPEQRPAPAKFASRPATPTPTPTPTAPASTSSPGAMQVQLAALTSEESAMTEWQRLSHKMPDLLASRHPAVSRSEHDGKTFYRLRTGGFSDAAQATQFCERIKAKGAGCSVASF